MLLAIKEDIKEIAISDINSKDIVRNRNCILGGDGDFFS